VSIYFSGIISGIDTEELIRQLMNIERRPIRLMQQKVSRIEEQQSAWRDVNTRLSNLETKLKDLLDANLYSAMKASSSDEKVATASVRSSGVPATYTLDVERLAQNHVMAGGPLAKDWTLQAGGTLELQVGDGDVETITLQAGASLHEVAKAINEQAKNVRASVVNVDGENLRLVLEGVATGEKATIAFAGTDEALLGELGLTNPEELQKPRTPGSPSTASSSPAAPMRSPTPSRGSPSPSGRLGPPPSPSVRTWTGSWTRSRPWWINTTASTPFPRKNWPRTRCFRAIRP